MKWWQKLSDYVTCYFMAWSLIILSPLWFPVWFAVQIYKGGEASKSLKNKSK